MARDGGDAAVDEGPSGRGYRALRRGRVSVPGTCYFLTFVTRDRREGLACDSLFEEALSIAASMPCTSLAIVLMPDHLHWLIRLDGYDPLESVVRLFKGRMSPALRKSGLGWQQGAYHDRRIRPDDELAPYLRYMLCNPYRAGLCELAADYPYWHCDPEVGRWFEPTTDRGRPFREWLESSADPPWETRPGDT